jgi:hypothetical protein
MSQATISSPADTNKAAPPARTTLTSVQRKRLAGEAPKAAAYASMPKRETLYCLDPLLLTLKGSVIMGVIVVIADGVGMVDVWVEVRRTVVLVLFLTVVVLVSGTVLDVVEVESVVDGVGEISFEELTVVALTVGEFTDACWTDVMGTSRFLQDAATNSC